MSPNGSQHIPRKKRARKREERKKAIKINYNKK
jgi:hypothetical protein